MKSVKLLELQFKSVGKWKENVDNLIWLNGLEKKDTAMKLKLDLIPLSNWFSTHLMWRWSIK